MATDETFTRRCLHAAQADVELCWGDYIDLVNKRQGSAVTEAGHSEGDAGGISGGEDMRNARLPGHRAGH